MNDFLKEAKELQEELTSNRRYLHANAETGFDLPKTVAFVMEKLTSYGYTPIPMGGGIVCTCGIPGKTLMIRADMDALPIDEASGAAFSSEHPGRMHACGHDGHMAMALAAATWVDRVARGADAVVRAGQLPRNILFVFQPAEETTGGAKRVCESGVFERYRVARIFGMHLWPDLPAGSLASRPGPLLARSSETTITFHGVSSHIAKWRDGRDALGAAARFVVGSKWLSRKLEQDEPFLLRFGHMTAGTVRNAVAGQARVEGSLRVFSDDMFARAQDEVRALALPMRRGAPSTSTFRRGIHPW